MEINGVINVCKEAGYTSHDVVAKLRGILHQKKIGHTGTLDPDATGVLPVCLGKGTRLCDMLTDHDKVYETVLHLGITTDTQDMSGKVLEEREVLVSPEQVRTCIAGFEGEQQQIPPMYSALKVNGKKLYELAREGKVVERKARSVHFFSIDVLQIQLPLVTMRVHCSKGTYIRTLCHDIGEKLGCGGCMEKLVRTRVERFDIENAYKLDEIREYVSRGEVAKLVIPVDAMFDDCPAVYTVEEADRLVHNGNLFLASNLRMVPVTDAERFRVYDSREQFIGIFQKKGDTFSPVKMFWSGQ